MLYRLVALPPMARRGHFYRLLPHRRRWYQVIDKHDKQHKNAVQRYKKARQKAPEKEL